MILFRLGGKHNGEHKDTSFIIFDNGGQNVLLRPFISVEEYMVC
jgi:hypothetical protein